MSEVKALNSAPDEVKRSVREYSDTQRLLIYLGLTFVISFAWFFMANPDGSTWEGMGNMRQSFVALGMLFPVIGHVITRVLTREGFKFSGDNNSYFGISFKDKKWICFIAACLIPWIVYEAANALSLVLAPSMFDSDYYLSLDIEKRTLVLLPVYAIVTGLVVSFAAFGEEGGWRGYMMPKLLKIMNRPAALITGGIIWGIWHAPLTCIGHNFGTDYPGFPYVGIVKMCVFCTLLGIMLTFLTEMSGSVWPAAFMHAIFNSSPSILNGFINQDLAPDTFIGRHAGFIGMALALLAVDILIMVKWKHYEKNRFA
ncbi:MAG: CPBP family intramembrane metalloprotease [Lachnospiraceae bacterium]|nr:CPBP family intramembrane metalloprotease [Lachnospiraceae bacterium]